MYVCMYVGPRVCFILSISISLTYAGIKHFSKRGEEVAEILNLLVDLVGVHTKLGVRKERRSVIPESTNYSI